MLRGMKRLIVTYVCFAWLFDPAFSQETSVSFSSSDTSLETAFYRAKEMALRYKGNPGDPAVPWYESALPPCSAFACAMLHISVSRQKY